MSGDVRKSYVINLIIDALGRSSVSGNHNNFQSALSSDVCLDKFLNDAEIMVLQAYAIVDSKEQNISNIQLSNEVAVKSQVGMKEINFVKKQAGPIPLEGYENHILTVSTIDSPLLSLYLSLRTVYAPKLLGDEKYEINQQLQNALKSLENGLRNQIIHKGASNLQQVNELDASGIQSLEEEAQFWELQSLNGTNKRAVSFAKHFHVISERVNSMNNNIGIVMKKFSYIKNL